MRAAGNFLKAPCKRSQFMLTNVQTHIEKSNSESNVDAAAVVNSRPNKALKTTTTTTGGTTATGSEYFSACSTWDKIKK
jgi:hypothetical protein